MFFIYKRSVFMKNLILKNLLDFSSAAKENQVSTNISDQISSVNSIIRKNNRLYLQRVIEIILFLAKQGSALRNHDDLLTQRIWVIFQRWLTFVQPIFLNLKVCLMSLNTLLCIYLLNIKTKLRVF